MSIQGDVNELNSINKEIKALAVSRRKLVAKKKLVEERIKLFLKNKDQPGVKHNGVAIILDKSEKRANLKKDEQERQIREILSQNGVSDVNRVLQELNNSKKGDFIPNEKLVITKIKQ
jgi:hypothetical protein